MGEWADEYVAEDYNKRYIEIAPGVPKRLVLSETSPLKRQGGYLHRIAKLGLKIKEFLEAEDLELEAEFIRQQPELIFDDGVEIGISLLLSKLLKKWLFPKESNFGKRYPLPWGNAFYNPIRDALDWWRDLIIWGDSKDQEMAIDYIKRSGLVEYFIPKRRKGREEALASLREFDPNEVFADPIGVSYVRKARIIKKIAETYERTLKDIQELFEKAGRDNRYEALMQYVKRMGLVSKLFSFLGKSKPKKSYSKDFFRRTGGASLDTITSMIVNELIRLKKPSEIAWCITGSIMGVGTKTLKKLYKLKQANWVKELNETTARGQN